MNPFSLVESQGFSMQLYETRIASLQRFVAMTVMFHELGKRVQDFWPAWTMGYLGYRIDRTHSIMRIATTASPVSGAEVRDRINYLSLRTELEKALAVINGMAQHFKQKSVLMARLAEMKEKPLNVAGAGIEKLIAPKSAKDAVREVAAKPPPPPPPPPPPNPGTLSARSDLSATPKPAVSGRNPDMLLQPVVTVAVGSVSPSSAVNGGDGDTGADSQQQQQQQQEDAFAELRPHAPLPGVMPE